MSDEEDEYAPDPPSERSLGVMTPEAAEFFSGLDPVHGTYGLPYFHEEGEEHRHDGVTDIHEGGDRWHVPTEDTADPGGGP